MMMTKTARAQIDHVDHLKLTGSQYFPIVTKQSQLQVLTLHKKKTPIRMVVSLSKQALLVIVLLVSLYTNSNIKYCV